jgi:transcriptional regulator with XRE-family HTH domain
VNRFRAALAKNLKRARSEQGLTQQNLAELCELSTNYLATVEIGGKFPSADTLERLATVLGLKPYQLFLEDGDIEGFDRKELVTRYRERAQSYATDALERAGQDLISSYDQNVKKANNRKKTRMKNNR